MELLKCYSTNSGLQKRITSYLDKQRQLSGTDRSPAEVDPARIRKSNRRLTEPEVQELIELYEAGGTVYDLAGVFGIHRSTVSILLERANVRRRYRLLRSEDLTLASELYASGWSLKRVGTQLGASAETVRKAFLDHGVPTRPRPGRPTG